MKTLDEAEYRRQFGYGSTDAADRRHELALKHALDIRKFEIDLYWRRATYFWTFIAAAFAAYGAIHTAKELPDQRHLSILVGSLGFVLSFTWYCVNRGIKRWQENWENHVDLLEDPIVGPLYKTVVGRPDIQQPALSVEGVDRRIKHFLTGPSEFSVTKINQIVSLFVTALWGVILKTAVGRFDRELPFDRFAMLIITLASATCAAVLYYGRSDDKDFYFVARQRGSGLVKPEDLAREDSVQKES